MQQISYAQPPHTLLTCVSTNPTTITILHTSVMLKLLLIPELMHTFRQARDGEVALTGDVDVCT